MPLTAGVFPLVFGVTDAVGTQRSVADTLRIAPRIAIATTRLAPGKVGKAYAARLISSGGVRPTSWNIARGALPSGLRLDRATGRITGSPRVAGTSRVTIRAWDRLGVAAMRTFSLVVRA